MVVMQVRSQGAAMVAMQVRIQDIVTVATEMGRRSVAMVVMTAERQQVVRDAGNLIPDRLVAQRLLAVEREMRQDSRRVRQQVQVVVEKGTVRRQDHF